MHFEKLSEQFNFGAKVVGIDLRHLKDPSVVKALLAALYRYGVLVFDSQTMTEREYINFGKALGTIKIFVDEAYRHPEFPEIFVVSNVSRNGQRFGMDRVGQYWHSDCSFLSEPQPITVLYCQEAPKFGGETQFIDMRAIWQNMDLMTTAALRGAICEHEGQSRYIITEEDVGLSVAELLEVDRRRVPPVYHPAIFMHPYNNREILYINEGFTSKVLGLAADESAALLERIFRSVSDCSERYVHYWKPRQLVVWDNRSVLHRAYPAAPANNRLMFRLGISDGSFFKGESP